MDAATERDVWTATFERRKQELIAGGMSSVEADEKASAEIRRQIIRGDTGLGTDDAGD